jgi:hypothetical protein
LPHTTTLLQRCAHTRLNDDDAAIQNDAPAAPIEADDVASPGLQALGILASLVDTLPISSVSFPRAPRGPPRRII